MTDRIAHLIAGRKSKWAIVALSLILTALIFTQSAAGLTEGPAGSALPTGSQSRAVAEARAKFPAAETAPAIVVITAADSKALSPANIGALQGFAATLASDLKITTPLPVIPSEDLSAAIIPVPLEATADNEQNSENVKVLREAINKSLPQGLESNVTGGPAFIADLAAVFAGADVKLLITTASVVAVLLLVTYRSPSLWLVPLAVVGIADQAAAKLVGAASNAFGFIIDGSVTGITSVLVFGAGTNYALLLIARYREELRKMDDRHEAMAIAIKGAGHAVIASSSTVILALLTLSFAATPSYKVLGWAAALGIVVAVAAALVALPAALLLFPRGIFWPFVPKVGQADPAKVGMWARIGRTVTARPKSIAAAGAALLVVFTFGLVGVQYGLTPNQQFRITPEAVIGQEILAKNFGAGYGGSTTVLTDDAQAMAVTSQLQAVTGVQKVTPGVSANGQTQINVTLSSSSGTDANRAAIKALRTAVGDTAIVGGSDAELVDKRDAADRDTRLIIPMILALVLIILVLLLRALVAPLLLLVTVVASFAASMGVGWFVFDKFLGFPGLDLGVPLLSFLFLVALGVDYNIFLALRAREEAAHMPTREAMVTALAVTGGVITSAGILLAAVFAVLGVLPLLTLAQLGVIVGFGVLLDTLVVRSLIVPALAAMLGEKFWWPSQR